MRNEPVLTANDVLLLNNEYFMMAKQILASNPTAERMHFVIFTNNNNLKIDCPVNERYWNYEMRVTVNLAELRPQYNNIDDYTSGVLLRLFESYKTNLVLH